jgi:hypothetical protein
MARTSTFPLYDKVVGGDLESRLRAWRAAGKSYMGIAVELRDLGIEVDPSTVGRWCTELAITRTELAG